MEGLQYYNEAECQSVNDELLLLSSRSSFAIFCSCRNKKMSIQLVQVTGIHAQTNSNSCTNRNRLLGIPDVAWTCFNLSLFSVFFLPHSFRSFLCSQDTLYDLAWWKKKHVNSLHLSEAVYLCIRSGNKVSKASSPFDSVYGNIRTLPLQFAFLFFSPFSCRSRYEKKEEKKAHCLVLGPTRLQTTEFTNTFTNISS